MVVGDGEVSDLFSLGTTMYTSMILLVTFKVLYEGRSVINGRWPAITCCLKNAKDTFLSRVPYTWYGALYGSIIFYIISLYILDVSMFAVQRHGLRTNVLFLANTITSPSTYF